MGSIRTLLAISVLVTHADPLFGIELLNGDMAITCFFMISGFLMALILTEKYDDPGRFYLNRALRIYPPYFAALLLSVAIFAGIESERHDPLHYLVDLWERGQYLPVALGLSSNLTLLGIDVTRYVSIDNGLLQFPAFLYKEGAGGHNLLFVPQAWTLAVELQFYLLAPFLVRLGTVRLAALTVLAFALRRLAIDWARAEGVGFDGSAFLPLILCFFLLGMLGYRLYRLYRSLALPVWSRRCVELGSLAGSLLLILTGSDIVYELELPFDAFFLLFAPLLPGLFAFSHGKRWDAWLGEFSYPVYLIHFALAQLLYRALVPEQWVGELTLLSTLLVSAAYIYSVDRPIQRLRARIAAGPRARPERRIVEVPAR